MLLAASESAVTKKPRLRLTMRRSSSVRPFGSFHNAMSRVMFTSCGIQWLEQVARYFSQAHLYLKGTSWLTSVCPLMMRLSAAETRRWLAAAPAARGCAGTAAPSSSVRVCGVAGEPDCGAACAGDESDASRFQGEPLFAGVGGVGLTSSSQVSMCLPVLGLSRAVMCVQSVCSHHDAIVLFIRIGVLSENADTSFIPRASLACLAARIVDRAELDVGRRCCCHL